MYFLYVSNVKREKTRVNVEKKKPGLDFSWSKKKHSIKNHHNVKRIHIEVGVLYVAVSFN